MVAWLPTRLPIMAPATRKVPALPPLDKKSEKSFTRRPDKKPTPRMSPTTRTIPPYAAPARGKDLSRLPPLCTYVGTVEPFYEETLEYCRRIREEGIPVHLKTFEGCFHGFDILAYPSAPAREARAFLQETFRYAQEHYRTGKPRTIDKLGEETI